ncbi:pilus assembly protein TadG-related protein [Streptomyces sp. URMC 127]|uniref:pilus assembly protein TadG-related protein n=1 Tax=Streptomyces sp. URMC 127 TaxID=3423402 RepID=UPI003F1B99E2
MPFTGRPHREAGQTLPIYITVVAGLLFLAFAYVAVGQAAVSRNGAQSAADAAALAAAQDAREQLRAGLLVSLTDPASWQHALKGKNLFTERACAAARRFAERNDAQMGDGPEGCRKLTDGRTGFTVKLQSRKAVGGSAIPGLENRHMKATATAVIVPRVCTLRPVEEPAATSKPEPERTPKPRESNTPKPERSSAPEASKKPEPKPLRLHCSNGRTWDLDPKDPASSKHLPGVADLFSVRLAD